MLRQAARGGTGECYGRARTPQSPGADRLHRIIGIDAATEKLLVENGVTRFADIAGWTWSEVEKVESYFGQPGTGGPRELDRAGEDSGAGRQRETSRR